MITGRFWGAQYEFWAHSRLARTAGLPDAIIDAVAEERRPSSMSDDERIVYDFCTELFRDKACPTPCTGPSSWIASASRASLT